jgi:hypothetical protein
VPGQSASGTSGCGLRTFELSSSELPSEKPRSEQTNRSATRQFVEAHPRKRNRCDEKQDVDALTDRLETESSAHEKQDVDALKDRLKLEFDNLRAEARKRCKIGQHKCYFDSDRLFIRQIQVPSTHGPYTIFAKMRGSSKDVDAYISTPLGFGKPIRSIRDVEKHITKYYCR